MSDNSVVITGIGVISSIGIGKDAFWKSLAQGISGIGPVSIFDTSLFSSHLGGEVVGFEADDYFDAKTLRGFDQTTRFLCAAAKLALADSGLKFDNDDQDSAGVVTATTFTAMENIALFNKEAVDDGPQYVNPAKFAGTTINAPSSQVSILFGIKGFNTTISTGFTAGLDALKYATHFIRSGKASVVLVGGVERLAVQSYIGFQSVGMLAGLKGEEILCPFDRRRNGTVVGEGAAVVVIENEEHARKRKASILAKVKSVAGAFDAYRQAKYHPAAAGLSRAIKKALDDAAVGKNAIDMVSSAANSMIDQDALETLALKEVFGKRAYQIPVSAVKSAIGELFSASGVMQLAAAAGALLQGVIPQTLGLKEKDPFCDLDYVSGSARKSKLNNILINNFGPGGNNVSAVISRYAE